MCKYRLAFFLMAFSLVTGCGQYGNLYLPDETVAGQPTEEEENTGQQEETEATQPEDL